MSFDGAAFGNDAMSNAQRRARNRQKYLCHKLKAPKSTEAVLDKQRLRKEVQHLSGPNAIVRAR
jgi:hypothetical protein